MISACRQAQNDPPGEAPEQAPTGQSFRTFCLPVELVSSRKQTIYTGSWRFQILEKKPQCEYTPGVVESLLGSTRPPGKRGLPTGSRPGAHSATRLEKHESSPRLAARDGMEQEPYEFRIRPAKPGSKGKATHGSSAHTPSLLHTKRVFKRGPALRIAWSLSNAAGTREKLLGQEK